jgi:DNA-binding NarL/FixJ family response regulator
VAAIKAVSEGLTTLIPCFAEALLSIRTIPGTAQEPLTPRIRGLQLLASGLPNKSIASQMGISEHTVKFHVNSILSKLGAQSRTEAVSLGTRLGLIKL